MIDLEQKLQDLHIDEQDTVFGKQWVSLSEPEILRIIELFIEAGFKPPESLGEMVVGRIIYDRMVALLTNNTTPLDMPGILQLVSIACGVENE